MNEDTTYSNVANDYGTLENVRARSNTVAHLFQIPSASKDQLSKVRLEKQEIINELKTDNTPFENDVECTSIVKVIDDATGTHGRQREIEVASGLGSQNSIPI